MVKRHSPKKKLVPPVSQVSQIDLAIALDLLHDQSRRDGDVGGEYWDSVIKLLKQAQAAQVELSELRRVVQRLKR